MGKLEQSPGRNSLNSDSGLDMNLQDIRHLIVGLLTSVLLVPLSSCGGEPQPVSISATTFNYSSDYLIDVWVNGKSAASLIKPAKPGEIKGGGGFLCCVDLKPANRTVEVKVHLPDETFYTVQAPVFPQPWPERASYAVVHVLPQHKILVEVTTEFPIPNRGRIDELLRMNLGDKTK